MLGVWISKAMGTLVPVATAAALIHAGQVEPLRAEPPGSRGAYAVADRGQGRLAGQTLARPRVLAPTPLNRHVPTPADEHGPVAALPTMQVMAHNVPAAAPAAPAPAAPEQRAESGPYGMNG